MGSQGPLVCSCHTRCHPWVERLLLEATKNGDEQQRTGDMATVAPDEVELCAFVGLMFLVGVFHHTLVQSRERSTGSSTSTRSRRW
ncbi:hypothetical protein GOODEAATRI_033685 [Goodea atripinnis]|uniref:Uncharacterized protein n=1 Tax=Goodea atripinnis TaxID=208336 RepID=A0ABV0P9U6_9TELE